MTERKTRSGEPFDPRRVRLSDPSTWEALTPTPKPPDTGPDALTAQKAPPAVPVVARVTWEDIRRQAVQCPFLSAMLEMMRQEMPWDDSEGALLWVALMLSEARIRALEEHAQTLMRMKP